MAPLQSVGGAIHLCSLLYVQLLSVQSDLHKSFQFYSLIHHTSRFEPFESGNHPMQKKTPQHTRPKHTHQKVRHPLPKPQ